MASYQGEKTDSGHTIVTVDGVPLPARHDLRNHSPDGFSWGYLGSGPAQLALAVLAHHFHTIGDEHKLANVKALMLYQDFKAELIATLPKAGWQFTTHDVADTLSLILEEQAERFFTRAMQLEVENAALNRELGEAYELLEQAASEA